MMVKQVDIEKLLHWSFREELCKGGDLVSSSFGIIIRLGQLGTVVDHDQFEPEQQQVAADLRRAAP